MAKIDINYNKFVMSFNLNGNVQKRDYTLREVGLMSYALNTARSVGCLLYTSPPYFDLDILGLDFRGINQVPVSYTHLDVYKRQDSTRPAALILGPIRNTISLMVRSLSIPENFNIVFSPRLGFWFNCNSPK